MPKAKKTYNMKKTILYSCVLASLIGMASCDEDYTDWAEPISNGQEEAGSAMSGTIAVVSGGIDREIFADDAYAIPVVEYLSTEGVDNVTGVRIRELTLNGTYSVPFVQNGMRVCVTAGALDSLTWLAYNSLAHTGRELSFSVTAGVDLANGESYAVTTNEAKLVYRPKSVIPACHQTVESEYYYVGGYNGWNLANPTPMTDNGDGTFSVELQVGDGEYYCFAPKSAVDAQDWSTLLRAPSNNYTGTSGFLGLDPTTGWSFLLETGGLYKFTVSPADYTYKVEPLSLYYVGDIGKWETFYPLAQNGSTYTGYYYVAKADNSTTWGFKFTTTPDFNNPQYGAGSSDGTIALDGGNIDLPAGYATGFYKIVADISTLTFTVTPITQISIVGGAVNHDDSWLTDIDLTFDTEELCWKATGVTLNAGEFKFRADHGWDLSWGSDGSGALTSDNGGNLTIDADGTYTIKFWPNCDGKGVYTIE